MRTRYTPYYTSENLLLFSLALLEGSVNFLSLVFQLIAAGSASGVKKTYIEMEF